MFHCSTYFEEFIKICSPLNIYMKKRIRKEKIFFFLYNLIFSGTSGTYCCNPCCYRFLVFHFCPSKSGTCSTKSGTFNGFLTFRPFFQCLLLFSKTLYICVNIHLETNEKPKKERKWPYSTSKVEQKMTLNRRSHEQRFQTIVQIDCNIQNQASDWLKKRFQVFIWVKTLSLSI